MLRGDIHIPFGNLQTTYETVMDNHALCAVLARSFNLINLYLFNQFTKNDGVQRFHLHKAPYGYKENDFDLQIIDKETNIVVATV